MPDCVTVNGTPLTETVPTLLWELGLAATVMPIVDGFAVPPPKETVIQGTSDDGVFRQLVGVPDAAKVKLSPAARALAVLGESDTEVQV